MTNDLNQLKLQTDSTPQAAIDYSVATDDGSAIVYFKNIESKLITHIESASIVVGCVAWLTSKNLINALASVTGGVAIVVQKEDFLRPDLDSSENWKSKLREMYGSLKSVPERHTWKGLLGSLSVATDPIVSPVRCVGNYNREKKPAFPRMHHKFLVFLRMKSGSDPHPYEVWTGSFNLTKNAASSFENAVVLRNQKLVDAYFNEWQQIEALSEPLDWTSDWVAPEWRIGT